LDGGKSLSEGTTKSTKNTNVGQVLVPLMALMPLHQYMVFVLFVVSVRILPPRLRLFLCAGWWCILLLQQAVQPPECLHACPLPGGTFWPRFLEQDNPMQRLVQLVARLTIST
jgi:hypothetical protein